MTERASLLGISKSLAPLRDVVTSLADARTGRAPAGKDRRRLVRRVRAAGVAAVPALVRALGSPRHDEATWAYYLLRHLGGARVVERLSRLIEDPRLAEDARARALGLLADLSEPLLGKACGGLPRSLRSRADPSEPLLNKACGGLPRSLRSRADPSEPLLGKACGGLPRSLRSLADPSEPPDALGGGDETLVARSVRQLLDTIEDDDDMAQAVGLIARQVPAEELPAFLAEVARHGGAKAAPLLQTLAATLSDICSPTTLAAIGDLLAQLAADRAAPCSVRTRAGVRPSSPGERARGLDLLEAGRLAEARTLLERVVAADPDDGEALSFLGVCCLELGDADAALPHLERAIAVEPDEALHQWNLAAAAKAADQLCRCHFALARYLELGDDVEGSRARRREARGFVREYQRTIQRAHPGVALDHILDGERLFLRAFHAFEAGRHDEAAAGFERVLGLVPRHYPSWGNLGAAYFALGRGDEATRCLRRALELKPDYAVARENLARLEGP